MKNHARLFVWMSGSGEHAGTFSSAFSTLSCEDMRILRQRQSFRVWEVTSGVSGTRRQTRGGNKQNCHCYQYQCFPSLFHITPPSAFIAKQFILWIYQKSVGFGEPTDDRDPIAFDLEPALAEQLNCAGINLMLLLKDAR